ncbi:Pycsar system effector family protein [Catenulispora pinisilvae]|uniref:Pycsar system effector family protein n=1 Tax=Catenulispora pinisilvae TaxID=2705253 RepID=UPI0018916563|nr:Pycsar system effector family protein [Catenulispora pinisilvae]
MLTADGPDRASALPPVPCHLVEQAEHAIDRADTKAAALGAVAVAILAVLTSGRSTAHRGAGHVAGEVFLAVGLLAWAAGVLALAGALLPRLRRAAPGEHAVSFCDLPKDHDANRMRFLAGRAAGDAENWLLAQGHLLSRIAVVKYRMIRLGMALLAVSGLTGALGMFLS